MTCTFLSVAKLGEGGWVFKGEALCTLVVEKELYILRAVRKGGPGLYVSIVKGALAPGGHNVGCLRHGSNSVHHPRAFFSNVVEQVGEALIDLVNSNRDFAFKELGFDKGRRGP